MKKTKPYHCLLVCHVLLGLFLTIPTAGQDAPTESPTASQDECVILLHGLARSPRSMKRMQKYLKKEGYRVYNLDYPTTKKNGSTTE
jgi:triacylglycerol esterase/lipase EstA (alpha/beta hydrolase family)